MPAVRIISSLQGKEVICKEKIGIFQGSVIHCKCCDKEYSPSAFEHHSGSSFRRPWKSIKDLNGKSIQEYREESERALNLGESLEIQPEIVNIEEVTAPRDEDVTRALSNDAESTPGGRKRKLLHKKRQFLKVPKRFEEETAPSPSESSEDEASPGSPSQNSPPLGSDFSDFSSPMKPPIDEDDALEPLFMNSSETLALPQPGSDEKFPEFLSTNKRLKRPDNLETKINLPKHEPLRITPLSNILVDYDGMRANFVHVATFKDLLECALDYWELSELSSPKDWVLTNEAGAMWPLKNNIQDYIPVPEIVFLSRKPWKTDVIFDEMTS